MKARMKTVILTPYRATPEREPIWVWVQKWIAEHYPMPVVVGDSDGKFSVAAARNEAARLAGDWDVAVFHDSDTIAHPEAVQSAVTLAADSMKMVVTADSHMYCDPVSSRRIIESGVPWFPRPASFNDDGVYAKPCSGIVAVSRELFDRVGGYVESLVSWGYEDLVFLQQCNIYGNGNTWVPGHINLHLWHPQSPRDSDTDFNKQVWHTLTQYRIRADRDGARRYLADLGHSVP